MGDVHQPLHNVQRYTEDRPNGDSGGNAFVIKYHYGANNLHSLWDKVLYVYRQSIKRPFTEPAFEEFGVRAQDLRESFNFTRDEVETLDFDKYIGESNEIAKIAYDNITEGSDYLPPQEYLDYFTPIARRRVALSGHRLAYMIQTLYGTSKPDDVGDDDDYKDDVGNHHNGPSTSAYYIMIITVSILGLLLIIITAFFVKEWFDKKKGGD